MNYAKAADMVTQLTTTSGGSVGSTSNRFLSERGSAIAEPRTNQLFVTDTAQNWKKFACFWPSWMWPFARS